MALTDESSGNGFYMPVAPAYGYGGMSRAGRSNAKRDSMGRYSRNGYSYADSIDGLVDEMRGMMGDLPEEKRREVERFVNKMDRM